MYDVVIIGSGPAGLSASIYAKRAGLNAVTIEKSPISGGQVVNTYEVDNYPGLPGITGMELGMKLREHADRLACEFRKDTVLSIKKCQRKDETILKAASAETKEVQAEGFLVETRTATLQTKTVLAAMGASHAKLNIPGEEELSGMGVSYCATCDGAFFKGKITAVIGGGDVAVEDAVFLAGVCQKVYLIHRRDTFRAAEILQKKVMSLPNVEIIRDTVAQSIEGEEQVTSLQLKNVKTGEKSALAVDGVFVAVGILPESGVIREITACDEKGYVLAGEDGVCRTPGVFAAGDIRTKKLRQIITAAADGANAIASIREYLLRS